MANSATDAANAGPTPRVWLKDLGQYVIWFAIWGTLFSVLRLLRQSDGVGFRLGLAALGAVFGAVCGLVFTLLQNGFNQRRRKWLSWLLAIGTWLIVNFVVTYAMRG